MKQLCALALLLVLNTGVLAESFAERVLANLWGRSAIPSNPESFPEGFLGIKWGSSKKAAITAMLAREGVTLNNQARDEWELGFDGGSFGEKPVDRFTIVFVNDQMASADVGFAQPKNERFDAQSPTLRHWVVALTSKYGKSPDLDYANPVEGLKKGLTWTYLSNSIKLTNELGKGVHIIYVYGTLYDQLPKLIEQQRLKKSTPPPTDY